ncbi:Uncharacterized protein QTN25_002169 [Entamoeba marina]
MSSLRRESQHLPISDKLSLIEILLDDAQANSLITTNLTDKEKIDRINLTLQIWDTTITVKRVYERLVFKGVNYFILVFDVTDSMTFNNLNIWLNEINDIFGPSGIPLCVVGNKVDINDRREVCEEEARKSKTSQNITNLFVTIVNEFLLNDVKSNVEDSTDSINIQNSSNINQNNNCCY